VGVKNAIPVRKVLDKEGIETLKSVVREIHVDPRIEEYIVSLVRASRERDREKADFVRFIEYGGSPRASIYLLRCAKVKALLDGRAFVIPEDVKALAPAVLRHRIILTYEAEAEDLSTDQIISEILKTVDVP
jgi:MoxR-like ATPase